MSECSSDALYSNTSCVVNILKESNDEEANFATNTKVVCEAWDISKPHPLSTTERNSAPNATLELSPTASSLRTSNMLPPTLNTLLLLALTTPFLATPYPVAT